MVWLLQDRWTNVEQTNRCSRRLCANHRKNMISFSLNKLQIDQSSQTHRRENVIQTQHSSLFTIVNSTARKIMIYFELYHPIGMLRARDWQFVVRKLRGFIFRNGYTAAWKIRFIIAAKANAVATKSDIFSAAIQQSFPLRDYTNVRITIKMFWRGRNKLPAALS